MLFRRFELNEIGRDVVVGDLHGEYDEVVRGLKEMRFDYGKDRLFSVGDLVDRGSGSTRCIKFLSHPWVCAVRGNHEDMFLEAYEDGPAHPAVLEYMTCRNGMGWWNDIDEPTRQACLSAWRSMPIAVEIETVRGKVGIVHAEVPHGMHWDEFRAGIEANDRDLIKKAIWGRDRIHGRDMTGVRGIDRVYVGHTQVDRAQRLGNLFYIDTGLILGKKADDPMEGRLSMHDITCQTRVYHRDPVTGEFLDLQYEEEESADPPAPPIPFGRYAM